MPELQRQFRRIVFMRESVRSEPVSQRILRPVCNSGRSASGIKQLAIISWSDGAFCRRQGPEPRGEVRSDLHETPAGALRLRCRHFDKSRLKINLGPIKAFQFSAAKSGKRADRNKW